MALYLRAAISARGLRGFFLVGSERHPAGCFLLGRLARIDADLRLLPHLRRKNGNVRYADAPARFLDVRDLVRYCGGAFALSPERYSGHVLHVWRAVYSALG